jgi:hypothetical protein
MAFTTNQRFNFTAFAIATATVLMLNGTLLMGFDQLASNGHDTARASAQLAKSTTVRPTHTLERVVITTRRA